MDEADARARLERMVAATAVPTLDSDEVDDLLALARRLDIDGRAPDDDGWVGTYDLNAAAAEGWRWKAGKVAGKFDFGSDGQSFNRSDMVKACQDQAKVYAARCVGSIPLVDLPCLPTDMVRNVNW